MWQHWQPESLEFNPGPLRRVGKTKIAARAKSWCKASGDGYLTDETNPPSQQINK